MLCFTRADALSSLRAFRDVAHSCSARPSAPTGHVRLAACDRRPPAPAHHPLWPAQGRRGCDRSWRPHARDGFPVTILKPSTTYGPMQGMLRQIAWEFSWIDRIRQGKPIVVCGQGNALHQYLHVEDAARGFAKVLGKPQCLGQTYNMVRSGPSLGRVSPHRHEVIGPRGRARRRAAGGFAGRQHPTSGICKEIFAHHTYYSADETPPGCPGVPPAPCRLSRGCARSRCDGPREARADRRVESVGGSDHRRPESRAAGLGIPLMSRYVAAIDQGTTSTRVHALRPRRPDHLVRVRRARSDFPAPRLGRT